jgi:hypothetical protein
MQTNAARFARRNERATETTIVDLPFSPYEQCAGQMLAECRLCAKRFFTREQRCRVARVAKIGAPFPQPFDCIGGVCRVQNSIQAKLRIDAARLADSVHEFRIRGKRRFAEIAHPLISHMLRSRREHSGGRPRRRSRRLARIEDANVRAAPGQFKRYGKADDPRTDDRSVARVVCVHSREIRV